MATAAGIDSDDEAALSDRDQAVSLVGDRIAPGPQGGRFER